MESLKDKVVWITGASSGIGEQLALNAAKEGAKLIISARNIVKLNLIRCLCLQFTDTCMALPLDICNKEDIESSLQTVIDKIGYVDILINNAGRSQRSLAKETDVEIDRILMETNFFGPVTLTKALLPFMLKRGQGHIAVISSITGKFGFPWRTAYSASKHALQGYFEALRTELQTDNIKVTIISPGRIHTHISENAIIQNGSSYNKLDPGQQKGMAADVCARKILRAIKKNKKDVLVGKLELLMVYIHKYIPWMFYKISGKIKN